MKRITKINVINGLFFISLLLLSGAAKASYAQAENQNEPVQWVGVIRGSNSCTPLVDHEITFTRKSDSENFDIENSPKLSKIHCQKKKALLVEIKAKQTSRFLFWGGNLVVENFTILKELEPSPTYDTSNDFDDWKMPRHKGDR